MTLKIRKVNLVYFSPTGTGKKIIKEIASAMKLNTDTIDLTPPNANRSNYLERDELAIFSTPVYEGRVPSTAIDRLKMVKGDKTPAVIVVMYGNRAYEDALLELRDTVTEQGFKPIAGAAFIGQHSFSSEKTPIGAGRPDESDIMKAHEFGLEILNRMKSLDEFPVLKVPGNHPYSENTRLRTEAIRAGAYPVTDAVTCNLCGDCAGVCPTGCVEVSDSVKTEVEKCMLCSACVHICPTGARRWEHEPLLRVAKWLSTERAHDRREPETFL
jgi:ferredoxin/flavodoxin